LTYVAGILPNTTVWAPGMAPLHPKTWVVGVASLPLGVE
jgi:hypothetical protein